MSVTVVISVSRVNIVAMIIVIVMVIDIGTVIVTFFVFLWPVRDLQRSVLRSEP